MTEDTVDMTILGRNYPVRVKSDEVLKLKETERMIHTKIELYEKRFSVKDKQDLLSMCIISIASELMELQRNTKEFDSISTQINETEKYLNTYLSNLVL